MDVTPTDPLEAARLRDALRDCEPRYSGEPGHPPVVDYIVPEWLAMRLEAALATPRPAGETEPCPTCWQPVPVPQRGDHDYGIPLAPRPAGVEVHVNDGSSHDRAMAWSEGHTAGYEEGLEPRPAGVDVERLARALMPRHLFSHDGWICHEGVHEKAAADLAELIAREYAALTGSEEPARE